MASFNFMRSLFGAQAAPRFVVLQSAPTGLTLHGEHTSYWDLYSRSFATRATVDFIARHLARYRPRTFQRDATGERPITNDHVAELFRAPAPSVSGFELLERLSVEYLLTGNSYAFMLLDGEGRVRGLTPTAGTVSLHRPGAEGPSHYVVSVDGREQRVPVEDVLHVRTVGPDPHVGLSPLDSVRDLLTEEVAASEHRRFMWSQALRKDGVIESDPDGPILSDEGRESFLVDVEATLTGKEGTGRPLMLLPGQRWRDSAWSPKDAEFVAARAQSLQLVCGVYGVPPQFVAASTENTRAASAMIEECLAPHVKRLEGAINRSVVPRVYGEQAAGGRLRVKLTTPAPATDRDIGDTLDGHVRSGVLRPNEARGMLGFPPVDGGDDLAAPPTTRDLR